MRRGTGVPSGLRGNYGPPADDPLAARLLPGLPGDVRWGLDRMERILAALGDPHLDYPVLHVAGTNGKGSVAKVWAEVLTAAGLSTGLYTSPPPRLLQGTDPRGRPAAPRHAPRRVGP